MFKRILLTLALSLGSAPILAASSLPTDTKFDSKVTLRTGAASDDLSMVLRALGTSVGLTVVTEGVPTKAVNYDIGGKPFREVWDLLVQLNGLDYEFRGDNIVVVGPSSVIASIRKPVAAPTVSAPALERRFYTLNGEAASLIAFLNREVPKALINGVGGSNKVISVTATLQEQGEIATLLSRVDPAPVTNAAPTTEAPEPTERRVYAVNGTPAELVSFLKAEFPRASINAVGSSKSLIVTATADEQDAITALLEEVDPVPVVVEVPAPPPVVGTVRQLYTVNGNPAELVAFLSKEVPGASVNTLGTNSKIISVNATAQQQSDIATLLRSVDPSATPSAPTVRQLYTANGNPADVLSFLKAEFPGVAVNTLPGSKTLSIVATEAQQDEIIALLEEVDPVPPPPEVVEVPAPPPPVPTVRQLYTINGSVSDVVAFVGKEIPGLSVNALGGSKVVAITGTSAQQAEVKTLLERVDPAIIAAPVAAPAVLERQTFSTNANAVDLAALVSAEFPGAVTTTLGKDTSRVLVVRAPSSVQPEIRAFLERVDPVPSVVRPDVVQQRFQLVNAKAEDLKKVLEDTLATQLSAAATPSTVTPTAGQLAQQLQTSGGTNNNIVGAAVSAANAQNAQAAAQGTQATATPAASSVTIIADARTNTLIARGTQLQISQIAELIPGLDRRIPSMNVQVRIQEVSETATSTLGLDWSAGLGNFTTRILNAAGSGLSAVFDATTSLAGFNIGATLNALERQGFSKRVDDSNVTLEGGQREAILKSGGEISINIVGNGTEKIEKIIPYGVQINLKNARVDPDGTIHIDVFSKVSTKPTKLDDPTLLDLPNREAQTSIAIKSGQTALLGGLLTNVEGTSSVGVPILSSIPVIGNLFKTETRSNEKTQLLLIISANLLE